MTPVAKGEAWGEPASLPDDAVLVSSDAGAREVLERARRDRRPYPPVGLAGGDLCRTLGGGRDSEALRSGATAFRVDVGEALVDGRLHLFVAHLVARTRFWGQTVVAMNAQHRGSWIPAPRAHPGDGLLDVLEGELSVPVRAQLLGRLRHGTHLPHPAVNERRVAAFETSFARPRLVEIDGVRAGKAGALSVRLVPDALAVFV